MSAELKAICAPETPCKCCGAPAYRYGVVDFHKNCESYRNNALEISGVPIYYHRCPACQFIFTTALDHFTNEDFLRFVYNEQYLLIDPDYQRTRPEGNATLLCGLFSEVRPERILDYGGGNGVLAQLLRAAGFAQVVTFDPFVARYSARPAGRFDCVVSFEVFEHSTDPARTLADMVGFLTDSGFILLSTLFQPSDIDRQGLNWWYASPRNAHISLYTKTSLERLVQPLGFRFLSLDQSYHVVYRELPDFAQRTVRSCSSPG